MTTRAWAEFAQHYNASMLEGAQFVGSFDIPLCPCTASDAPQRLIAYSDLGRDAHNTRHDAFVHFYINDCEFDTPRGGIWNNPKAALKKLQKCRGVITPDFSTCQDMPVAMKIYNTYRMRAFGFWLTKQGFEVINNIRWGTPETYSYCFDGIPTNGIVSIGTVGCIREKCNWQRFSEGLDEMIRRLRPSMIIVYGSAPDRFFAKHRETGISIVAYPSRTQLYFDARTRA